MMKPLGVGLCLLLPFCLVVHISLNPKFLPIFCQYFAWWVHLTVDPSNILQYLQARAEARYPLCLLG